MYKRANAYSRIGFALASQAVLDTPILAAAWEIRTTFMIGAVISPRNMRAMALMMIMQKKRRLQCDYDGKKSP